MANEVFEKIDPYVMHLVQKNWGYFAKMCEAVDELAKSKGNRKAYQRGYRAAERKFKAREGKV